MVDEGKGARFSLLGAAHRVAGEGLVGDRVLVRHEAEHLRITSLHYKALHRRQNLLPSPEVGEGKLLEVVEVHGLVVVEELHHPGKLLKGWTSTTATKPSQSFHNHGEGTFTLLRHYAKR